MAGSAVDAVLLCDSTMRSRKLCLLSSTVGRPPPTKPLMRQCGQWYDFAHSVAGTTGGTCWKCRS